MRNWNVLFVWLREESDKMWRRKTRNNIVLSVKKTRENIYRNSRSWMAVQERYCFFYHPPSQWPECNRIAHKYKKFWNDEEPWSEKKYFVHHGHIFQVSDKFRKLTLERLHSWNQETLCPYIIENNFFELTDFTSYDYSEKFNFLANNYEPTRS